MTEAALGAGGWLHVAARRHDGEPRPAPASTDARTIRIHVRGADLTQSLAAQIFSEEARKRIGVKVF